MSWTRLGWLVGGMFLAACLASAPARRRMTMTTIVDGEVGSTGWWSTVVSALARPLGPPGTKRQDLRYYKTALLAAMQFGGDGVASVLEIGCASPAFVGEMRWIPKKTCVAPYHAGYATTRGSAVEVRDDAVEYVAADFAEWNVEREYDFCVCMQVLEHVDDPAKFLRKMLDSRVCRRATLVSVPYKWGDCGEKCSHRWHGIDEATMRAWSGGRSPAQTTVIREREGTARLIIVYALNYSIV
jgi:SAM-dependent methyltransferase